MGDYDPKRNTDEKYDVLGKDYDKRPAYFGQQLGLLLKKAWDEKRSGYRSTVIRSPRGDFLTIGAIMETEADLMKAVNKEAQESIKILHSAWNDVMKTADMLEPELIRMVKRIRETRMTVTMELKQSLTIMKDVRRFFLDSEYKKEIARLEHFVGVAEKMKALIEDGTMDAVTDVMLKLAIGEEAQDAERESVEESG